MRTLLLVAVGAVSLGTIGWVGRRATADSRAWNELLSYAGKDLARLSPEARARANTLYSLRTMPVTRRQSEYGQLWKILRFPEARRVVFIEATVLNALPAPDEIVFHVFDSDRHPLSWSGCTSGCNLQMAEIRPIPDVCGRAAFEILDEGAHHEQVYRQVFSLLDETPVLIRLETRRGLVARNSYGHPDGQFGPDLPARTSEEWEAALRASDPIEVLRSLVWLAGHHEHLADAPYATYHAVRKRPGVVEQLQVLKESCDPWIAEAARQAGAAIGK